MIAHAFQAGPLFNASGHPLVEPQNHCSPARSKMLLLRNFTKRSLGLGGYFGRSGKGPLPQALLPVEVRAFAAGPPPAFQGPKQPGALELGLVPWAISQWEADLSLGVNSCPGALEPWQGSVDVQPGGDNEFCSVFNQVFGADSRRARGNSRQVLCGIIVLAVCIPPCWRQSWSTRDACRSQFVYQNRTLCSVWRDWHALSI